MALCHAGHAINRILPFHGKARSRLKTNGAEGTRVTEFLIPPNSTEKAERGVILDFVASYSNKFTNKS